MCELRKWVRCYSKLCKNPVIAGLIRNFPVRIYRVKRGMADYLTECIAIARAVIPACF